MKIQYINSFSRKISLLVCILLSMTAAKATVLNAWDFVGKGGSTTVNSTTTATGVGASTTSFGSAMTAVNFNSNGFTASELNFDTLADAITGNSYISFTITPDPGKEISVSSIQLRCVSQNGYVRSFNLFSSINGFLVGNVIGTVTGSAGADDAVQTITVTGHENFTTAVTFRIYVYGFNNDWESVGLGNGSADDLIVNGTINSATVTARGENLPDEGLSKLTDGNIDTKWLDFATTSWVRFQYTAPQTWNRYTITSGNDEPTRDPKNWTLQGSNNGSDWTTLDTQTGISWATLRKSPLVFSFANATAYSYYKWDITLNNGSSNIIQSSEFAFSYVAPDVTAPTVPAGLASGVITTTSIVLNWTISTDAVGVTAYDVYKGGVLLGSPSTNTYTATGLTASTSYSFTVKAKDAANNISAASSDLVVSTADPDIIAPTVPTSLSTGTITSNSIVLNWAASADAVGVTAYEVYKDGALIASPTATTYTFTGLTRSTSYSFTVKAKDAQTNTSDASAALVVSTTAFSKTVGATGADFTTLKLAFDAINANTGGEYTGDVVLKIIANTTETVAAVLNASGSGSAVYTSVSIYPSVTGCIVSGALATPLIDLNGADNVTIDGRLNATGATPDLIITNTSTAATAGTSTLRLIADATANTVKYCTLKGSTMDPAAGVVFISTGTTTGNDTNVFDYNNITCSVDANRPLNALYSLGSAQLNNAVTISNNNFYNFLNKGTASYGINIGSNSTAYTIVSMKQLPLSPRLP